MIIRVAMKAMRGTSGSERLSRIIVEMMRVQAEKNQTPEGAVFLLLRLVFHRLSAH